MDQFFYDALEELEIALQRDPTYEEVMEYMDSKDARVEEWFLKNKEKNK